MAGNLFDRFTVFFTGDKVFLDGTSFPLQEKTDSAAVSAQEKLNAVWDLIFELPVYRTFRLDMEISRNLFPALLATERNG